MGVDSHRRKERPDNFKMSGPRVWWPLDAMQSAALYACGFSARSLLVELVSQLRTDKSHSICNNGDLTTAESILKHRGWKDPKTIRSAAKELEEAGLIFKTRQGHRPNTCNLYAVTWLPLNESPKHDFSAKAFPMYAYRLKNKPPPLQATKSQTDRENSPITKGDSTKISPSD